MTTLVENPYLTNIGEEMPLIYQYGPIPGNYHKISSFLTNFVKSFVFLTNIVKFFNLLTNMLRSP